MRIDGLDQKPPEEFENLGTWKLKDKQNRNAVEIDLSKATRPLAEASHLYVVKVPGENNKIQIKIKWKPKIKEAKNV